MQKIDLDIVLPCYNPLPHWAETVVKSVRQIEAIRPVRVHLKVVNDGSSKECTPGQQQYLLSNLPYAQMIDYKVNRGKGYALRQGVQESKHPYCIYTDIDFPYTLDSFLKIYDALIEEEADISVAIRNTSYYDSLPKVRVVISKFLKFLIRSFLRMPIDDTQGGLKGFNQKGKQQFLSTTIDRYLFDLEFIYKASKRKEIRIKPIEVDLKEGVVFSNMNPKILWSEGLSFLKILFLRR